MGGLGNKPAVTCEICGKKLADPSSLYRHRKIHSGDKPHKCPYCTRRFIQRYNFQILQNSFNVSNNLKIFSSSYNQINHCSYRYNMKQHIKTHRLERMTEEEKAEYLPKHKSSAAAVAR